jgi:hypothetical protein
MTAVLVAIALASVVTSNVFAQTRPEMSASRVTTAPRIDGVLDDETWREVPPLPFDEWLSYNPLRGDRMPAQFRTEVRIAYDDRNLYFAFHCFDDEPDRIRTTVSRRDTAFNDDWVAMSLDSAGTGQAAYHLFVNPSGSQMDAINTSASGEQFDADVVWYSAGRVTTDGYVVEVALPLQSLRFASGDGVRMGILFFRKISRTGVSYSSPGMPSGQWVFENHAHLNFSSLKQPRLVEALPSVTYGVSQRRASPERWNPSDRKASLGMSGKFGITSNITLDGTLNPDFSQVESDAFQVEVNQRFPVFYSEKRPFFMEGMGLFNIAGAGAGADTNMRTSVHTRKIIDPRWGTKITGTAGKTTFGLLNALDEGAEDNTAFSVARATYALRNADYLGAILTDTEHAGRHNRVVGVDTSLRFSSTQGLSAFLLASDAGTASVSAGRAVGSHVTYGYETRRFMWSARAEHYDRAFEMDTAFFNRSGFSKVFSTGEVSFYPAGRTGAWLQRIHPFYMAWRGHDEIQDGDEDHLMMGARFNFTRQGYLEVQRGHGHEPWQARRFETGRDISTYGNVQILRWLFVSGGYGVGPEIFYDPVSPFQGRSRGGPFGFTLQPNQHLSEEVNGNIVRFDRASTGARVYDVNIVNSKTTYQFDKHFLVRLLEQFDSSAHRLLTDVLASYEVVPGTVFHAGYGSLYERQATTATYLTVNRGLFFKASYLHRF